MWYIAVRISIQRQPETSMGGYLTPAETRITAELIPEYRTQQHATHFASCSQVNQIFLKADGKISCSCMRYHHILAEAKAVNMAEFFNGDVMRYIRESFIAGKEPFAFCQGCPSRVSHYAVMQSTSTVVNLHIEPSSQCNLFCGVCTCTYERLSDNPPSRRDLDFDLYAKMLNELNAGKMTIRNIAFVGFGEPLFNSRTHDMAALGRRLFPDARLYLDTNGNFGERRAEEIADCGLNEIRLGIDGIDQTTYVGYRKNGNFQKAFAFAGRLAASIRAKGSKTRAIWKYILFSHNDRDEHVIAAIKMADQIGIDLIFDTTVGDLASRRSIEEIRQLAGERGFACNIDPAAFAVSAP
jgi:Radical SAM superfamily